MKLTSSLLIACLIAISFSNVHGGIWPFGSSKTTPKPSFPGRPPVVTPRSVAPTPARGPPVKPTPARGPPVKPTPKRNVSVVTPRAAPRPAPTPARPPVRQPPVVVNTPKPTPKVVTKPPPTRPAPTRAAVTRPPVPPTPPTIPPSRSPTPPAPRVTPRAVNTPKPTPKAVTMPPRPPSNTPRAVVVPPVVVTVRPPVVVPPVMPVRPPVSPVVTVPETEQPGVNPTEDLSCMFFGDQCSYVLENASYGSTGGVIPTANNKQAWVRSKLTSGSGPYCLKTDYISIAGTIMGTFSGGKIGKATTSVWVKTNGGQAQKLHEFVHFARTYEIRSRSPWLTIDTSVTRGTPFSIWFGMQQEDSANIKLNSLSLVQGSCPPHQERPTAAVEKVNCTFNYGEKCDYNVINAKYNIINWEPTEANKPGRFISPQVSGVGPYCLTVKYNEIESQMGTSNFSVYIENSGDRTPYNQRGTLIFDRYQPKVTNIGELRERTIFITIDQSMLTDQYWKVEVSLLKDEYGAIYMKEISLADGVCSNPTRWVKPVAPTQPPATRRPINPPPVNPPVVNPPVVRPDPAVTTKSKYVFKCSIDDTEIPSYLRCDGIQDCKYGEDEMHCMTKCEDKGFYCKKKFIGTASCLEKGDVDMCDGLDDCEDGVDEHPDLCGSKVKVCDYPWMFSYCQNNRYCNYNGQCDCGLSYSGKRCQTMPAVYEPHTSDVVGQPAIYDPSVGSYSYTRKSSTGGIVGGVIAVLFLIGVAGFAWYKKRVANGGSTNYGFRYTK